MQDGLIKRLTEKFKTNKSDLAKKVASIALASSIAIGGLGLTACSCKGSNTTSTSTSQEIGSESSNGGSSAKPDYSKYSQILQTVLTDDYYENLLRKADINGSRDFPKNNAEYMAIPYAFLEEEGFNIEDFKEQRLSAKSELFVIENNLYVELIAEISSSTNYLASYVLKYTLTDKELNEFDKLFTKISANEPTTYYQAPFFVQELSYQKEPEVLSCAYIRKESKTSAEAFFNKRELISKSTHATYLGSNYINEQTAYHKFLIRPATTSSKYYSQLGVVEVATNGYKKFTDNGHIVSNITTYENGGVLTSAKLEEFENSITNIKSYTCRNHLFKDISTNDSIDLIL